MVMTDEDKRKRKSERGLLNLLNDLGLECYGNPKQVQLQKIFPNAAPKQHLEIDIIGIEGKTGFLIEITELKKDPTKKIKKFIYNAETFLKSKVSWKEKINFFKAIPEDKANDFEDVTEWKKIYFGTSNKLLQNNIDPSSFPGTSNLHIFNSDELEYLKSLTKNLGKYAKYQFLASVHTKSKPTRTNIVRKSKEWIEVTNRLVTGANSLKANVYLTEFSPEELLETGRVYRYGDLLMAMEDKSSNSDAYQRILIKDKIKNIAENFLCDNKWVIFPNTIVVVLSRGSSKKGTKLLIPKEYASIDIIDGQHRVFAYAHESISDNTRQNARILATVINFKTTNVQDINKSAAKLFWEINSAQTTVKHDLLYLIKYGGLGDTDPTALAGEIIRRVDKGKSSLANVLKAHPIRPKNKFEKPPIPIVSIVEEISNLIDLKKHKENNTLIQISKFLGGSIKKYEKDSELLIEHAKNKIGDFFNDVQKIFPLDWSKDSKSDILSSNYLAAFVKLLFTLRIEKQLTRIQTEDRLKIIKKKLGDDGVIFEKGKKGIVEKRAGIKKIFEFLLEHSE